VARGGEVVRCLSRGGGAGITFVNGTIVQSTISYFSFVYFEGGYVFNYQK